MTDFISVIIPAYNAEATIGHTLSSALAQTGVELEVIVVDDGSTDRTAELVEAVSRRDGRIRLLRQRQGGVARARNLAIASAQGNYVAPLDADDIWHPEKLSRQLHLLRESPADVGMAYNWFRRIDEDDRVIPGSPRPTVDGWVFHRHLTWNFISNGSTPLIRRAVLDTIQYNAELYDRQLQGCEDYLIQLEIARHYRFACVPAFLTGYRQLPGAMSTNVERMIRSHIAVFEMIGEGADKQGRRLIGQQLARLHVELARTRLGKLDGQGVVRSVTRALAHDMGGATRSLRAELMKRVRRRVVYGPAEKPFSVFGSTDVDGAWALQRSRIELDNLEAMDRQRS
ncbi:glycosyltransferase family 2 protein [Sphingobium estronivorans]|uniref:glycosyltransferase family 2 protein n=1 Tax=Sphingobium estronivorans TaxID=1577690 RepID=UPI00123ABE59|nr:glycosyltransferase family 2 protein [Sphingobium estronivorans]